MGSLGSSAQMRKKAVGFKLLALLLLAIPAHGTKKCFRLNGLAKGLQCTGEAGFTDCRNNTSAAGSPLVVKPPGVQECRELFSMYPCCKLRDLNDNEKMSR